jgi:hypothetical protein
MYYLTMGRPERRRALRFQVALPVEFADGMAVTHDFSACGVFFETSQACSQGECIEFTAVLEHVAPGHPVRLRCRGQVVRVERRRAGVGVAVAITAYRFDVCTDRHRGCQRGRIEAQAYSRYGG